MNAIAVPQILSPEEYLQLEMTSEIRHEYIGRRVTAMAGGTSRHARICLNVSGEIRNQLRGREGLGNSGEQRIRIEATGDAIYPDASIQCPPFRFHEDDPDGLTNPSVVFEVLSPSTELRDRVKKFALCQLIPECTDYVLIHARQVRVEHFSRDDDGNWRIAYLNWRRDKLVLTRYGIALALDEIYLDLELAEGMILVDEDGEEMAQR